MFCIQEGLLGRLWKLFATLVDRGHRELPIRPDFIGKNIPTSSKEHVRVFMKEFDGKDAIELYKRIDF